MIIRGGENIFPSEIENVLLKHDSVIDAQIVGAPDYRLGEVVVAYIRAAARDVDDVDIIKNLKQHCVSQGLAKYKIPKHWRILDEFPATLSGKVKKFELRKRCAVDFDLST